jgi:hypothetical protein
MKRRDGKDAAGDGVALCGRKQDIPEAFSAAGLMVPDSIARVYCCRQDYQHPIPSRLCRGLSSRTAMLR